jgi:hypothetical protein
VNTCTNFISNTGNATVYGISNIQSQYVVTCNTSVPVEFIYINAVKVNNEVTVSWATASETNNKFFLVERSNDGINFTTIGMVPGNNNSSQVHEYEYKDMATSSTVFYRVSQVDYDNSSTSSNVVKVMGENRLNVLCYPNPFSKEISVQVVSAESFDWSVTNNLGQEIMMEEGKNGATSFTFGQSLAQGVYFLKIQTPTETKMIKINKE